MGGKKLRRVGQSVVEAQLAEFCVDLHPQSLSFSKTDFLTSSLTSSATTALLSPAIVVAKVLCPEFSRLINRVGGG